MASQIDELLTIEGTVPDPVDYPNGCRFLPRCSFGEESCQQPQLLAEVDGAHLIRCGEWQRVKGVKVG